MTKTKNIEATTPKPTKLSPSVWLEDLPLENAVIRNLNNMGYDGLLEHQLQAFALFYDISIPKKLALPKTISERDENECKLKQYRKIILSWETSAGKTVIAMLFIDKWLRKSEGIALYCLPYKQLAEEMFTKFKKAFNDIWKVGISTGDYSSVTIDDIDRYDLVIVTYDKLNSLLRKDTDNVFRAMISCVALDEIHMINTNMGFAIEDVVMKLKNTTIPLIALSATVGNESMMLRWMSERNGQAVLFHSDFRPIKLRRGIFVHGDRSQIRYEDGTIEKCPNLSDNAYINSVVNFLRRGMSVIQFRQTRRNAQSSATGVADWFKNEGIDPLNMDIKFSETANKKSLERATSYGCGYHHGGMVRRDKNLITELYEKRHLNFIASTTTLSAGINIPASVGLVEFMRFDIKEGLKPIPKNETLQCFGRIGRPQFDSYGTALLLLNAKGRSRGWIEGAIQDLSDMYFIGKPDPILSSYYKKRNLLSAILGVVASGDVKTIDELEDYLKGSLSYLQNKRRLNANADDVLYEMKYASNPLIKIENGKIIATSLGKAVNSLYVHPKTAIRLIEASQSLPSDASDFAIVFWACSTPEFRNFYPPHSKKKGWIEIMKQKSDEIYLDGINADYINPLMTAMVLVGSEERPYAWIRETDIKSLEKYWSIQAGDLQAIIGGSGTANWIMYAFSIIAKIMKNEQLSKRAMELGTQIRYGIRKELIELVKIREVGRSRARKLWNRGYKDAYDVADADVDTLAKINDGGRILGKKTASKIITNAEYMIQ